MAEDAGYFEAVERYVPNLLSLLQQWGKYEGPTPDDPAVLGVHAIPGAGHAAPLSHPEALAEVLTEFFASVP